MKTRSLLHSFRCALAGLAHVVQTQRNARIHLIVAAVVTATSVFLQLSRTDSAILALTIGCVFAAEIANTVVEAIVDLVSPEYHPLARVAKDAAAGAVFCLAATSVVVGLLLMGPLAYERLIR